ncbi:MAG: hydrogenase iron-sulfur subunit [Candidatus Hodarchaeota archaeon]
MDYKILIISTPGVQLNENFGSTLIKDRENVSVLFKRKEDKVMLDINELLRYFYEKFDGILVLIKGKMRKGNFESNYKNFQKIVNETNRILAKRGLSDGRIKIYNWDGENYKNLNESITQFIKKLKKLGPNPVKFEEIER